MPGVRFPAWLGRRIVAKCRVWDASRESVRNYHKKTHHEDTVGRAVSPPLVYLLRSFSRTSRDASEEVSIFPHLPSMSDESGEARCAFRAEVVSVSAKRRGR